MGNTNRRRRDDRRAELHTFTRWLETEYACSIEWEYTPRGMLGQSARALAIAIATRDELVYPDGVRWEVSGEIVMDTQGYKELKAHMEILARLMMDLQVERMYGVSECEYALSPPAPGR